MQVFSVVSGGEDGIVPALMGTYILPVRLVINKQARKLRTFQRGIEKYKGNKTGRHDRE